MSVSGLISDLALLSCSNGEEMNTAFQALGFYSIGLKNIAINELFQHLRREDIPFLHLRSGPKGYGLTKLEPSELDLCIHECGRDIPVTMLASDITLESLAEGSQEAKEECSHLQDIALNIGAKYLRILAPSAIKNESWENLCISTIANHVVIVIELHNPEWFSRRHIERLKQVCTEQKIGLLFDSSQIDMACQIQGVDEVSQFVDCLLPHVKVIHFSDSGGGFSGVGHQITALAAIKIQKSAYDIELAFEWTGKERTTGAAFAAYRRAENFWHSQCK